MGPLAGIGDSFFWGTFRVIGAGIGAPLAVAGNVLGPIIYALINVIPSEVVRRVGFKIGYNGGSKFLERISSDGTLQKVTEAARIMGLMVIGAMIPSMVTLTLGRDRRHQRRTARVAGDHRPDLPVHPASWSRGWLLQPAQEGQVRHGRHVRPAGPGHCAGRPRPGVRPPEPASSLIAWPFLAGRFFNAHARQGAWPGGGKCAVPAIQ